MLQKTDKRSAQREATIEAILDAFERVLVRDGAARVGVNALSRESRVSKPQIYKYFGDLAGLVREWGRRRRIWPTHEELVAGDREDDGDGDGDPKEYLKRRMRRLGDALRKRPLTLEVLADELAATQSELAPAFRDVRAQRGQADRAKFRDDHPLLERENFRLVHVIFAAIVYFAMRSRRNPELQGIRLDTDEGWDDTMQMIEEIIDDAILASSVRGLIRAEDEKQA